LRLPEITERGKIGERASLLDDGLSDRGGGGRGGEEPVQDEQVGEIGVIRRLGLDEPEDAQALKNESLVRVLGIELLQGFPHQ